MCIITNIYIFWLISVLKILFEYDIYLFRHCSSEQIRGVINIWIVYMRYMNLMIKNCEPFTMKHMLLFIDFYRW
jgi:hypothetical protein